MLDVLHLPGIEPVNIEVTEKILVVKAVAAASVLPHCQNCGKPMHRHGKREHFLGFHHCYRG